jgi:hypothetical protein
MGCKGNVDDPGSTQGGECSAIAPTPPRIWRLSTQQYSNSVRDLLGLQAGPSLDTTGGTSQYAFFSDDTATVDPQLAYQINMTVRQALSDNAAQIPALAACQNGEAQDACAARFAKSFGTRAFRRQLGDDEVTALMTVYAQGAMQDFNTGISLMIQALLQSPSFVFRTELGNPGDDPTTLTPYEVATQLSYTFVDSTPDQPLLDAAASNKLGTAQGIGQQVDRLLATDAGKQNITRIVVDWFNAQQLYAKTKDPMLLADLGDAAQNQKQIQDDFYNSVEAFVDDALWNRGGKVNDLLTSQKLFVNQRLATLFGLPFTGSDPESFVGVDAPPSDGRAGMLTQPAVLWALSDVSNTSIVKRGITIHNDVICADPLPPPNGILNDPNVQAALAMLPTEIDKVNYRKSNQLCASCHTQIDPYGLVLEAFDPIGRARTMADGLPVENSADFSNSPPLNGQISGAADFSKAIIADKQFSECAAQKVASYVLGRMIRVNATCEVQQVRQKTERGDGKLTTMFRQVATAGFTQVRSGGAQ